MTTAAPLTTTPVSKSETKKLSAAASAKNKLTSPWASLAAVVLAVLWTIPTFGLLISSFRPEMAIKRTGWWTFFSDPEVTLDNYRAVFDDGGINLADFFLNSLVITIPSVVIPLCLASLAAYAFAWMNFPGKNILFIAIFALQIVPLQVTLVPLLQLYVKAGLNNTFWTLWLSHSTFALPLAIYLLHNFIKEVPSSLIEAARIDGAGHVSIFFKVLLPLLTPALAAFGIFQFLWVWNDLLVSLTFAGSPEISPMTVQLSNLSGTRGTAWHLLSAGAFVSIVVPVTVFLLLQRYFVRGLLAGSVKG
ncbi:alpha-glucoside transport system permease protein [Actinoplanes campanulatus]|uniref:Alpha-glucoside transport system permease protein n=1 Tax=Actinoplanes campanulatus TaxID=113559 RepID=A0A7W5FFU9_9ACTN|nr:carbohydrate ABC transporter permease [Actinoplanes campanulatus]MBB3096762.1 alpha-glucoside transport system permease protein [Actinoplanes campanulatus]GGN31088.1 sugar ABC transporter permease [Actinoplanes campanulatus]GID37307.1 sugar ABC transporter permease [Actinoplanes campanulatus]